MIFSWLTTSPPWTLDPADLPDRYDWSPVPPAECAQCGKDTGSPAVHWCRYECHRLWHEQKGAA